MKVTLNWLKQYVDFDWSPEELAERLTMLGVEVEGVQKLGGEFAGVVVAQVITRDKHPNADKLSLCRVNDGKGERQIVCGADNFKAGDKVPLILPGNTLPTKSGEQPMMIKAGKIRGFESQGMLCSPQELGLPDNVDGLLILRKDARVGQPFAEYLTRPAGDVVYDLEITPNRPDLNSLIGIAREISAATGNPLRLPAIPPLPSPANDPVDALVAVRIEDAELCPRYAARVIRGVKVGPSPDWLKSRLEKVGVRSISNVVDVTNFVMLETGQPLHAFDYHLVGKSASSAKPTIVVRRAAEGEKFTTLDGQQRTLTNQMLLIADEQKGIALAGVMGGKNSEINERTQDVLIESAYFKPQNIRATSKKLDLRTDASYRYERGADVGICDWASQRAAQLILETAGGQLAGGVVDAWPKPNEPRQIVLRHSQTDALIGIPIPVQQQVENLKRLGLDLIETRPAPASNPNGASSVFKIPSFRVDLKGEVDLIEEIVRLYGVDKVPATPPRGATGSSVFDSIHDELSEARRLLAALGLNEAQGQTLISETNARVITNHGMVALANPLSSDMNVLRPSLLPGLLDSLRHNLHHRNQDVALFELGRVFKRSNSTPANPGRQKPDESNPVVGNVLETRHLAIALTGQRSPLFWQGADRDARADIYDLKGLLEEFFERFGIRGISYNRRAQPTSLFIESASIHLGKFEIGQLGQVTPALAKRYDLRDATLLAELDLDVLLPKRNLSRNFKAIPAQPSIRRDVAMLVPEPTTHESVVQTARQAKPDNLENIELFDVFRGKNIPAGQKSVAYAFTYRSPDRTLTDAEVNAAHERLVGQLKEKLHAVVREG